MKRQIRLVPGTVEGRMIGILAVSLVALLAVLIMLEVVERRTPIEWAESSATSNRLKRMHTVLESILPDQRNSVLAAISVCHEGYTLTEQPFVDSEATARTAILETRIADHLAVAPERVSIGYAGLTLGDFSYASCAETEIKLPMTAIVVSTRLSSGEWFNTEVHPHEWHVQDLVGRMLRYSGVFLLIGVVAIWLVRQLSKPLNSLTNAAQRFADGLKVSTVEERGPPDLKRAIQSFNTMQQQVADDVKKRAATLAAISHDLRTPLTALRIRAELIEDDETRDGLVRSINKMERIIASALEYLKGGSRSEPLGRVDISALLASECSDFQEAGQQAEFIGGKGIHLVCRPEALGRAVRNLIENANKYGDGAIVDLCVRIARVELSVSDTGPGIPEDEFENVLLPFHRLSKARESHEGGFGLGLAVVKAVVEGHDGRLILAANDPNGLIATIRFPMTLVPGRC